jgi:hypothetical protein
MFRTVWLSGNLKYSLKSSPEVKKKMPDSQKAPDLKLLYGQFCDILVLFLSSGSI